MTLRGLTFPRSAFSILIVDRDTILQVMREMGRKGGKRGGSKGGKARMGALTPEERSRLARSAAEARWRRARKSTKAKS